MPLVFIKYFSKEKFSFKNVYTAKFAVDTLENQDCLKKCKHY